MKTIQIKNIAIAQQQPLVLIAGPCQIESEQHAISMATQIKSICEKNRHAFYF